VALSPGRCRVRPAAGIPGTNPDPPWNPSPGGLKVPRPRCRVHQGDSSADRDRTSELDLAETAGKDAATAALEQLGQPADLVLVYSSVRYDLTELLSGIRQVTGDTPLIGASSSGHFHRGTVTPPGRGVAVLAMTRGEYRFGIGTVTGLRDDPFAAGRTLATAARQNSGCAQSPYAAMVLLSCGITGTNRTC
jgi:hypothetical protein